jgi:hypothetical protein
MSSDKMSEEGWEVDGVELISPSLHLKLATSPFAGTNFFADANNEDMGRKVGGDITRHCAFCCATKPAAQDETRDESLICYSFGALLHHLFSGESLQSRIKPNESKERSGDQSRSAKHLCIYSRQEDFSRAISLSSPSPSNERGYNHGSRETDVPSLRRMVSSPAVSQLVQNLLDSECDCDLFRSDDSYSSLGAALSDIELLLGEPRRFLFRHLYPSAKRGLIFSKDKLYGRSVETAALVDAFCRVASTGKNEAYFVGGFSG